MLPELEEPGHGAQGASADGACSAYLEGGFGGDAEHESGAGGVSEGAEDFVFYVCLAHAAGDVWAGEDLRAFVGFAPEAWVAVCVGIGEPVFACAGGYFLPEVEDGGAGLLGEEPGGEAEAAIDGDGHGWGLGGECDEPGGEGFAGAAIFKGDVAAGDSAAGVAGPGGGEDSFLLAGALVAGVVNCDEALWELLHGFGVSMAMVKLILFCFLVLTCWPLALAALVLYPVIWLVLLPFRVVGVVFEGVLALLFLPVRALRRV